ncbi:SAM-dependent methyltransferase [Actinocatenispora comari]|uniref:S-adenosyl methyltransferase n=1 Tax=Actinocatenispora comari TaxID=2807577 RepID=A0A8J4AIM9_9ACTN|nr:SAM-dependent methyltransferase [Actinocatenispora comari]GIL31919.1 hypothetical protein NUM_71730 [Actinocatenispora comari]
MGDGDELDPEGLHRAQLAQPSAARMYDFFLGGGANFDHDRRAAEQALSAFPALRDWAGANRSFLRRVVTFLCGQGFEQFLDLGSGIPTVGNVHEIAQRHRPEARVAYVDWDPVAVAHGRQLLGDRPGVSVTQADVRHPDQVLAQPGVADFLDWTRPVAVLAFAIIHAIPDRDDPVGIVAGYRDASCPGSALAVSHGVVTTMSDEQVERFVAAYRNTPTPATFRDVDRVADLFAGYSLVEPGLVLLDEWRPDDPANAVHAEDNNCYGGVGILPAPR